MKFIQHMSYGSETPKREDRKRGRNRPCTFVIELDEKTNFHKVAIDYVTGKTTTLKVKFGLAVVHPNDEFNRKIGIATASDKSHFKVRTVRIGKIEMGETMSIRNKGKEKTSRVTVITLATEIPGSGIIMLTFVAEGPKGRVRRAYMALPPAQEIDAREESSRCNCGCGCGSC